MEMRRKNMLALGLSFVLGVGSSTMPVLADISAKREEVKLEKEEVQEIPEESNVLLDSMFANTMEHTSENNLTLDEVNDSLEDSTDSFITESSAESANQERGSSAFRSMIRNFDNDIQSIGVQFQPWDVAGRDHMKVVRTLGLKITSLVIKKDHRILKNPESDIISIMPERTVEKKEGAQWLTYNKDYYTPGVYRYIYTLKKSKSSSYNIVPKDTEESNNSYSILVMYDNFLHKVVNTSYLIDKIGVSSKEDSQYIYYPVIGREFTVEEEKTIAKAYLSSTFDIHKAKVGDRMQRVTLQVEKLVLTDGTVVLANAFSEPFFVNVYDDYPDTPNQFKLFLDSYKNAAGEQGKVWNASEDTLLPAGRYKVAYYLSPNYKIGKYRLLLDGTDDDIYGTVTQFYVNNELYSTTSAKPEKALTASIRLTSDFFEPIKVEKKTGESSGSGFSKENSLHSGSSSSGGSSSGSGGSGGSSGGGSGSFKVSTSFSGQVLGVDRSLSGGEWIQDEKGWWYKRPDGSYPKNSWGYEAYNGKSYWYYFLDSGYMATGWVEVNGSKYYLFPNSDGWKGRMLTGWQWIDGNCYYLDSQGQNEGALYRNTTTPDGYAVDAEGRWVVNGAVQKQ